MGGNYHVMFYVEPSRISLVFCRPWPLAVRLCRTGLLVRTPGPMKQSLRMIALTWTPLAWDPAAWM